MTKINEKGGLAAKLFHWGYRRKSAKLKRNVPHDKVSATSQSCLWQYWFAANS
jgi:hypothetical protein